MATNSEIQEMLEKAAKKYESVADSGDQVLTSEGEKDIDLPDGRKTPNLNKRLAGIVQAVKSVNGKDGNVEITREDLNIPSDEQLAKQNKEDRFVITESGRTQRERNKDHITALDFNITSVGNETEKFNNIPTGSVIDLLGKTYTVDKYPTHIKTINGKFNNLSSERGNPQLSTEATVTQGNYGFIVGLNTAPRLLSDKNYYPDFAKQIIVLGNNNLVNTEKAYNPISIGTNNFKDTKIVGAHNIAIGSDVMWNLASTTEWYNQNENAGTRNIGIGGNALTFLKTGFNNLAIGRNSAQCLVGGVDNVAVGSNALGGQAPIGLNGEMTNESVNNCLQTTVVGAQAMNKYIGEGRVTAIGFRAAGQLRMGRNAVVIGHQAAYNADKDISGTGKVLTWDGSESGTYTQTGNTLTLSVSNTHGAIVGGFVTFRLIGGESATFQNDYVTVQVVSVVNNASITVAHPISRNTSGTSIVSKVYSNADAVSTAIDFVAIGFSASANAQDLRDSTVVGHQAGSNSVGSLRNSTLLGSNVGRNAVGLSGCTAVGRVAMFGASTYTDCTAIGQSALIYLIDGSTPGTLHHATALGHNARVSGNNQLQLGAAGTSVYAYGAIQDRSDIRDKADIEEMPEVMTEFVLGLNPVQGRWDMRDDYVDELPKDWTDEQRKEWWSNPHKDGSKKRSRKHNWFIAQEVKALADKLGVDFAGLQDHKLIDGTDTLTIGYEEFIPPIVATIQKLNKRLDDIESRLSKLE